jgi:hypothetical protein
MSQKQTQVLSYAYACAAALAVALHPGLLSFLDFSIPGLPGALSSALTWAFLLSCVSGAVGIAKQQWWGFAGLYLATIAGSFGLAICMVPFIIELFPRETKAIPLLVLNAAFLLGLIGLHIAVGRRSRAAV